MYKGIVMRALLIITATVFSFVVNAADVITCGDAMSVGKEAKASLHKEAQKRAQKAVEDFTGKKLTKPYIKIFGQSGTPESTLSVIEVYWCETETTPLHSAYYRLYSSNKLFFE